MTRIVRVVIQASQDHPEILTIQDALQQALDFFALLTDDANPNVAWKLTLASTNSPLTLEGEPVDMRTLSGAFNAVEDRVSVIENNFVRLAAGLNFDDSFPLEKIGIAKKILSRNINGIGATIAKFDTKSDPIIIDSSIARNFLVEIDSKNLSLHSYLFSRTARKEQGSVEGRIVGIATDYGHPALRIIEQKSGREISCQVSEFSEEELSESIKAKDAWSKRRVRVRGTLNYDETGKVVRVTKGSASFVESRAVSIDSVIDSNFTEGYDVRSYLERFRENEFGK